MDEELEQFRKSWKDELTVKISSNRNADKIHGAPAILGSSSNSDSVDPIDKPNDACAIKTDTLSNVDKVRSQPNTLEPFLLAERLLEESNSATGSGVAEGRQYGRNRRRTFSTGTDSNRTERDNKRRKENTGSSHTNTSDSYLDAFLADLNEINDIPFFEISLPRELAMKIFKFLDATDLCHCAQVSKAWQSLAEDEVLWCAICHQMAYEQGSVPLDRRNWKAIVKEHVTQYNRLQSNWKTRTGRSGQLQHVQGGILRAAHSHGDKVTLGYTNGDVKFWRIHTDGEECVFKPSDTALQLLPDTEEGMAANVVTRVVVNDTHVVAGYSQGYVDVWSQEGSTRPVHSFRGPQSVQRIAVSPDTSTIAASFRSHLSVVSHHQGEFTKVDSLDTQVSDVKLVSRSSDHPHGEHVLVLAMGDTVSMHVPGDSADLMTSVSHVYGQVLLTLDANAEHVAFGFSNYLYNMTYGVHVFDIKTCRQVASLQGYTAAPSCVDVEHCPPNMVVTGCRSSVVRVYDMRAVGGYPVMTLQGHQRGVQEVQMDEWKVLSGGGDGLVCVWDQRMGAKLWELTGRHPVRYARFDQDMLVTAHIPEDYCVTVDPFDNIPALRYRGSVHVYDFSSDHAPKFLPDICSSTYDEPAAYNYNVRLAMPYDSI